MTYLESYRLLDDTSSIQTKKYCRYTGTWCDMATDMGYCRSTACCLRYNGTSSVAIEKTTKPEPIIKNPQWIPANKELPKHDDWKIVTILEEYGDTQCRYTDFGWYLEEAECWIVDAERRTDVIAWAPLPEPYKEEEND